MIQVHLKRILILGICFISICTYAQDEEEREDDLGDVSDTFQEHFFEGLKQAAIENHEKAIVAFNKCLAEDQDNATVQFELGKTYLKKQEYVLAEEALKKAVAKKGDNEWYLDSLYEVYDKTNKDEEAIAVLKKLTKHHSDYKLDLVKYYFNLKQFNEALVLLDEMDEEVGRDRNRDQLRKVIYNRSDQSANKIAFYKRRINQYPTEEEYYLQLILEYSNQKKPNDAFKVAQNLLEKNPSSEKVHLGLYKFYLDKKEEDKAVSSMLKVIQGNTIDAGAKQKVLIDFLRFTKGKEGYDVQLKEVAQSVEQTSGNEALLKILADYYQSTNQDQKAIAYLETASEANMNDYRSLKKYLLALAEAKSFDKLLEKTNEAIEFYPSQPLLYLLNAAAYNNKNQSDKAIEALEIGLDYIIDDPILESDMYHQLAKSYQLKNDEANYKKYLLKAKAVLEGINK